MKQTLSQLNQIGSGLKKYFDRYHSGKSYPFIAGGSIRDLYFGYAPKDYDVFLDASIFPDDTREDCCDLLSYEFLSFIGKDFANYERMAFDPTDYPELKNAFNVYTFTDPLGGPNVQLICCTKGSKNEIIKDFDYDLVRCWYDIDTAGLNYSPEFLASVVSKTIVSTTANTTIRINNWFSRHNIKDFTIDEKYDDKQKSIPAKEIIDWATF
jgi:hypothetical protein